MSNQGNPVSAWRPQVQRRVIFLIPGMDGVRVTLLPLQVAPLLAYTMFLMLYVRELVATSLKPFHIRFG